MELQKKLLALISASTLVLGTAFPAVASISGTASNSGNGAGSTNRTKIEVGTETVVSQGNQACIHNKVNINSNTGHNKANYNTGGDVSIETGGVDVEIGVKNSANANFAEVEACVGCDYDILVENVGNGAGSENKAKVGIESATVLWQENKAKVGNDVNVNSDTGHNKANYNTSEGGEVSIETGPADTVIGIDNAVNTNQAVVGGGDGLAMGLGGGDGLITVRNEGNGAFSDNKAKAEIETQTVVTQANRARVRNDVDVNADTGHNKAKYNTGGDVEMETGPIDLGVGVRNSLNLNAASVDDCCDLDLLAENHKNGSDSENKTKIEYTAGDITWQENKGTAKNEVDGKLETGHNKSNYGTADDMMTGDVEADVVVETEANTNVLGHVDFDFADWNGIDIDFDNGFGGRFFGWWLWMWLAR
ncbi:MAG: hypothetical protein FJ044_03465 [Candidatus Cloacimonetes bacterium]|nr:hypothetical protein [Candidatus Cloacimonadota bacterium]